MITARESFWSWLERRSREIVAAAVFIAGMACGWLMRGGEHAIAGRCHTPSGVSIVRHGGDLIVRCAP